MLEVDPELDGVWVLYFYDVGPQAVMVHPELVKLVETQTSGELIAFWPYGVSLSEALKSWNERKGPANE